MTEQSDIVMVPVPREYLGKVYRVLGGLDEDPDSDATPKATTSDSASWSTEEIQRQFAESPKSMKKFQKYLADHVGESFTTSEIATALGAEYGWNTIAGMLGAYGNRVKNRYKKTKFPFDSITDHSRGEVVHSMNAEVAEIVKAM